MARQDVISISTTYGLKTALLLALVFSVIFITACCLKVPKEDKTPPEVSVQVYDSSSTQPVLEYYNVGTRRETWIETADDEVRVRFLAKDVGGVSTVTLEAFRGTLYDPGSHHLTAVIRSDERSDYLTMDQDPDCPNNSIGSQAKLRRRDASHVILRFTAEDYGGTTGTPNSITTPDINVIFRTP